MQGGYPPIILAAGYVGSTIFGAVFTLGGWDTLVAKVLSFILGVGLICPLVLVRDKMYASAIEVLWIDNKLYALQDRHFDNRFRRPVGRILVR